MKHCTKCGAELTEGMKFCGNCGAPVEAVVEEALQEEEKEVGDQTSDSEALESSEPIEEKKEPERAAGGKRKKILLMVVIAVVLVLGIVAILLWQSGVFREKAEPASTAAVQTMDKENLYKTLDWQENQDKTYEAKNSLIEGNSDANLKEIFEASAYFTPKEYKYATNGETEYHLVASDYKKGDKKASYALVFQVNKDKHLELVELYKDDKKVDKKDYDGFYEKLYKTKEETKTTSEETKKSNLPSDLISSMVGKTFYSRDIICSGGIDGADNLVIKGITDNELTVKFNNYTEGASGTVIYKRDYVNYQNTDTYVYYIEEDGYKQEFSIRYDRDFNDGYWIEEYFLEDGGYSYHLDYFRVNSKMYDYLFDNPSEAQN